MLGEGDIGATRLDPYDTGKATARLVIERNLVRTLDAQVELRFLPDGGLLPDLYPSLNSWPDGSALRVGTEVAGRRLSHDP